MCAYTCTHACARACACGYRCAAAGQPAPQKRSPPCQSRRRRATRSGCPPTGRGGGEVEDVAEQRGALDVTEETVAQPAVLCRAIDQTGYVGDCELVLGQRRGANAAEVRVHRREGVRRDLCEKAPAVAREPRRGDMRALISPLLVCGGRPRPAARHSTARQEAKTCPRWGSPRAPRQRSA